MEYKFDVVIVGSGAAGLPAAWMFTKAGYTVALIEQGKLYTSDDYIDMEHGGEVQKFTSFNSDPNAHCGFSWYNVDSTQSPISPSFFHSVGGSTTIYSAQHLRFKASDFSSIQVEGNEPYWPIQYTNLLPYYELNDQITGVSGLLPDPNYPEIIGPYLEPVPLGTLGVTLRNGFSKLGWHHWPAHAAINSTAYRGRPADTYCRPTNLGDPTGSKGSVQHTYLPMALSMGLKLFADTKITKINIDQHKRVESMEYVNISGNCGRFIANKYILAAGAIGTPRLLLVSSTACFPSGIANSSGLVGKNLMLHPYVYAEGLFEHYLFSNFGPQGCCIMSHQFFENNQKNGFNRGFTIQSLRGPFPMEFVYNYRRRKLIKPGVTFWTDFFRYYNKTAHLTAICEDLPLVTNYLSINSRIRDKHGIPSISIQYSLTRNSLDMLAFAASSLRAVLKASGAYKTFVSAPVRHTGWHILGTCKLGKSERDSVVNPNGQTHDIENLYIVDSSVFPTSSSVNPASTIQALSLYLSDQIISRDT